MLRSIKSEQRLNRVLSTRFNGAIASPVDLGGRTSIRIVKNSTGNYTLTFATPFQVAPVVVASLATASTRVEVSTITTSSVILLTFGYNNTTATDAVVHVTVSGLDTTDVI
jgi:hypothetical protein